MKEKLVGFFDKLLLLYLLFISGCSEIENPVNPEIKNKQTEVSAIISSTANVVSKTNMPISTESPTPQLIITPTPTSIPIIEICSSIPNTIDELFSKYSYRVFSKSIEANKENYWITNVNNMEKRQVLKDQRFGQRFSVSEDGNWIAYLIYDELNHQNTISVSEVNGSTQILKSGFPENLLNISWLDNNALILWYKITDQAAENSFIRPLETFEPFTGISKKLQTIPNNQYDNLFWFGPKAEMGVYITNENRPSWILINFEKLTENRLLPYEGGVGLIGPQTGGKWQYRLAQSSFTMLQLVKKSTELI